jgi:hypothetical protein
VSRSHEAETARGGLVPVVSGGDAAAVPFEPTARTASVVPSIFEASMSSLSSFKVSISHDLELDRPSRNEPSEPA